MASTLNIDLVSYEFPPMNGGEGIYTYGLAKALSDLGHNVTVITTDLKGRIETSDRDDFNIVYISPIKKSGLKLFSFNIFLKKKIIDMYKNKDIDILHHTNDYYFLFVSKKDVDLPIIATVHHPYAEERRIIKDNSNTYNYLRYLMRRPIYFHERMEKITCKKADNIIAASNYTAQSIIKEYNIPSDKVRVIPNAVSIEKFNPKIDGFKIREKWNLSKDKIVLFVGRLDLNKGIKYLIEAFSKIIIDIPNARLMIVGDGPLKNDIKKIVSMHNMEKYIIFAGNVESKDLPKFYAASDIVVLPSLMEGFGIVLLEAMATGKPCIATKAGGTKDVILNGKTGFLVPPADSYALYHAMRTILINDDIAKKFGNAGLERVKKNFTWNKVVKQTLNTYKEIL